MPDNICLCYRFISKMWIVNKTEIWFLPASSYLYVSAICGIMKTKDPTAIMTEPVAIHAALLYRPPIKLTNSMIMRAPISWEAGMREDLELVSWNWRSMAGSPALAIPLMANPSRKQNITNQITSTHTRFKH